MYSFAYSHFCKNRVYTEIDERISEEILSANIEIIQRTFEGDNTSYSAGFSGVIFKRTGNKYYALTAYHAVDSLKNSKLITLAYNEPTFIEYVSTGAKYIGLTEYYKQFPIASVEYYDEKYDLAILSFESNSNFKVLDISDVIAKYGDKVVAIGNPYGEERNMITYGKITSRNLIGFNDEAGKTQYKSLKHSAFIDKGSSGSALMNKNFKIIGINLGGGRDVFGNFRYGMAMPSNKINDFLDQWDNH
jgi:serine protease Do